MSTILVIDDDPDIRGLVEYKLSRAGLSVYTENDGQSGLAVAEALLPDLVVVDWMMPRLTGVEVCRRLRSSTRTSAIPLVLLTAKAQAEDVECGLTAGANDYIVKPFSPRELLVRIENLLDVPARAASPATHH